VSSLREDAPRLRDSLGCGQWPRCAPEQVCNSSR
jgi:hypothetical protein